MFIEVAGGIIIQTSQPSQTAQAVAMGILFLSQDPLLGKLVAPDAIAPTRWFIRAFPGWFAEFYKLFDLPLVRTLYQSIEKLTFPGISIHNALRKCWLEEQTLSMITDNCKQVIVLGAGFDTLAYRLHRLFPAVRWWEVDHPATQQVKERALREHGDVKSNLALVPLDFTQQTLQNLLEHLADFNSNETTLFIAEGLLMYLKETEVIDLLQAIHSHSGFESIFLGSVLKPAADGRLAVPGTSPLVDIRLQIMGEPYRWGLAPENIPKFFSAQGFDVRETIGDQELISRYIPEQSKTINYLESEYLFRAQWI
jgi:methyltransferase (TIGR00027 family)